jgi:hypothetical protein
LRNPGLLGHRRSPSAEAFNPIGLFTPAVAPLAASGELKPSTLGAGVAVVVVVIVVAFVTLPMSGAGGSSTPGASSTTGTGSVTSSAQGGNQTYIATFVSTTTSEATTVTSTVAVSTAASTTQTQSGDSFTYTLSSQVKVLTVSAQVSGPAGDQSISFSVTFENIGTGTIYVAGGDASALNATIVSGATSRATSGLRCEGAVALVPISPGSESTSTTPGCWSGYSYQLQGPTVQAEMTLSWSGANAGTIDISAQFAVA